MAGAVAGPERAPRRRGGSVPDLLRTLAVLLVPVLLIGAYFSFLAGHSAPARRLDPGPEIAAVQSRVSYHVLAPRSLPSGWAANHVDSSVATLQIGWVLPNSGYVELNEGPPGDAALVRQVVAPGRPAGTVTLARATWQRYVGKDLLAVVRTAPGPTVVLLASGHASLDDVRTLAASLK